MQFIFIRAVFSAVFSLTVLSGLLFLLLDFFLVLLSIVNKIHSFIHSMSLSPTPWTEGAYNAVRCLVVELASCQI